MIMPLSRTRGLLAALLAGALLAACGGEENAAPEVTQEQIQELKRQSEAFQGMPAAELLGQPEAVALGRELAAAHCAGCHGWEGSEPQRGVPRLATAEFNYGDSAEAIRTTISQGRHSLMPPLGKQMGEVEIGALVALVQGFSKGEAPATFAKTAQELYQEHCVACHGPDGKGNPALGAPDLTDHYWLYGDSMMNIRLNITRGLDVRHPALADSLSQPEIELLTAWVLSGRL